MRLLTRFVLYFLLINCSANAQWQSIWQVGNDEDRYLRGYEPTDEFSVENGANNPPPGTVYHATTNPRADDDFYFPGTYPAGFNGLTAPRVVSIRESDSGWERALTATDTNNRVHFFLTATQANTRAMFRLTVDFTWGVGWYGAPSRSSESFGRHDIQIRFRGSGQPVTIFSNIVDSESLLVIDFPASNVFPRVGPNTIEIFRTGMNFPGGNQWIQFDFLKFEVDPQAYTDADADGIPRFWEELHKLSDSNSLDATFDLDRDGLTSLQEYNGGLASTDPNRRDSDDDGLSDRTEKTAGTDPLKTDSDSDSLTDAQETRNNPPTNPLRVDTDLDGFPDAWEVRVGTNPSDASQKPSVFRGAIGVRFLSAENSGDRLGTNEPAGFIPQFNWNETFPISPYRPDQMATNGSHLDILTPSAGRFVRSDGMILSNMQATWQGRGVRAKAGGASGEQKLFSHALEDKARVTITNIPFAKYDLYVYLSCLGAPLADDIILNDTSATLRKFYSVGISPSIGFREILPGRTNRQHGNFVRYGGLTNSSATVSLTTNSTGIAAIQIIDAELDIDQTGIPDWYEMKHALQPASAQLASSDSDGDGLSNIEEFRLGANPRNVDSDSDGLSDDEEQLYHTDPSNPDSDFDGFADGIEVKGTIPSNPSLADSDGDGVSDRSEVLKGSDPNNQSITLSPTASPVPKFSANPSRWQWIVDNVQIVWDHGTARSAQSLYWEEPLIQFCVRNANEQEFRSLKMGLRSQAGKVTQSFFSHPGSAFSHPDNSTWGLWDTDWTQNPSDLTAKLGLSGYGSSDVSSILRFEMIAARRQTSNSWDLTFSILNRSKGILVYSNTFFNWVARPPALDNGTTAWTDFNNVTNSMFIEGFRGIRVFFSTNDLEFTLPFAATRDLDDDGMADTWEIANGYNPNDSMDANEDDDDDFLNNRSEFELGSNPRLADSDGDGISDLLERSEASNPNDAQSVPNFVGIDKLGSDLNGDGLPDAWQLRYKAHALFPYSDTDGDGAVNDLEAGWGTDPFNPDSKPILALTLTNNNILIGWPFIDSKVQQLYVTENFENWSPAIGESTNSGSWLSMSFPFRPNTFASEFFYINTTDKDTDIDGVSDWDEIVIGADPLRPDSLRSAAITFSTNGGFAESISGDLAAFAERFRTGPGKITDVEAARLLQQATFGPTFQEIEKVRRMGVKAWIFDQITNQLPTFHRNYIEEIYTDFTGPNLDPSYVRGESVLIDVNLSSTFARAAISGSDQLRQRVAFALSQILVTSKRDAFLANKPRAMADYYDIFVRNAFGNYLDVLREVTLHPVMGRYLSHLGNQKARPEINQYPDENYAREIQQLFSIGLWELNEDGTRRLDPHGEPIPTYGNAQITQFARVFTGLWLGNRTWGSGGYDEPEYLSPMQIVSEKHDFGPKTLLLGFSIPARAPSKENAMRDINDALKNLFEHPNTPPFISRQLIQFLVTSNPSTNYVYRVASVFKDDGKGARGNLAAVIKAILVDSEARDPFIAAGNPEFGRLKEPVHRAMAIGRMANLAKYQKLLWYNWNNFYDVAYQDPGNSPSVFNFFRPSYQPPGLLTERGLIGPAFQITDSYTSLAFPNKLWEIVTEGFYMHGQYHFPPDYSILLDRASEPEKLADAVNLLFCGGSMSLFTRDTIILSLNRVWMEEPQTRILLAVYIAAASPEGAVQK